jgi:hypothetical protein
MLEIHHAIATSFFAPPTPLVFIGTHYHHFKNHFFGVHVLIVDKVKVH